MGPVSRLTRSSSISSSSSLVQKSRATASAASRQKLQQQQQRKSLLVAAKRSSSMRENASNKSGAIAEAAGASAITAAGYSRQGSPMVFDVTLETRRRLATPRVVVDRSQRQHPKTPAAAASAPTARKSSDLKRIRDPQLRTLALVNSPMIDSRRQQQRRATLAARSPAEPDQQQQQRPRLTEPAADNDAEIESVKAALEEGDECEKVTRAYRMMLHQQWEYFRQLIGDWREVLSTESATIPEPAQGSIRTAIGMAELLCVKKFPFFENMLAACVNAAPADDGAPNNGEGSGESAALPILPGDVSGYWVLVEREIDSVKSEFGRLETERSAGWPAKPAAEAPPTRSGLQRKAAAGGRQPQARRKAAAAAGAGAKSRFAEFRKKHVAPFSSRGFGVGAISSPMVTFAALTGGQFRSSTRKSFATKTPGTTTPAQMASNSRTPTAERTPAQNLRAVKTSGVENTGAAASARPSTRPASERDASSRRRQTIGVKSPTNQAVKSKNPRRKTLGSRTPGKEATAAKSLKQKSGTKTVKKETVNANTPGKELSGTKGPVSKSPRTKTPAKEAPGTKTPVKEAPGTKTPGKEALGTKSPVKEAPGTKTPGKDAPGNKTPDTKTPVTKTRGKENQTSATKTSVIVEAAEAKTPASASSVVKARIKSYEEKISASKRAAPKLSAINTEPQDSPASAAKRRRSTSKSVSFNAEDPSGGGFRHKVKQLTPYPDRQTRQSARKANDGPLVPPMEELEGDE